MGSGLRVSGFRLRLQGFGGEGEGPHEPLNSIVFQRWGFVRSGTNKGLVDGRESDSDSILGQFPRKHM